MTNSWVQLSFTFAIEILIETINLTVVSHLNDEVTLAAVSLGHNIIIMLILSTIMGTDSALETHVAHAYGA